MKVAYIDTSCLVALAFEEAGASELAGRLYDFDRLFASNLLEAEFRATLVREGVAKDGSELLSWVTWVYPNRPLRSEFERITPHTDTYWEPTSGILPAPFLFQALLSRSRFLSLDHRQS